MVFKNICILLLWAKVALALKLERVKSTLFQMWSERCFRRKGIPKTVGSFGSTGIKELTLMLLVADLANTKIWKRLEKWLNPVKLVFIR